MRRLMMGLAFSVLAMAGGASAQSDDEVYQRIEDLHGNAAGFSEPFKLLTEAMRYGDPVTVAGLADYPLTVEANGEVYDIPSAEDLVKDYDALVMAETQTAVADQAYSDLFVNSDGVMLANGAIWFVLVCENDGCETSRWTISRINN